VNIRCAQEEEGEPVAEIRQYHEPLGFGHRGNPGVQRRETSLCERAVSR
jgi:hypothetical protein